MNKPFTLKHLLLLSLVVALLTPTALLAKKKDELTPLVQRARTVLVQVDVRVEDAEGNPVLGLTAKDFILVVDGEEQEISTFDEIITTGPGDEEVADAPVGRDGPTVAPSYFIFFFDNVLSNQFERSQSVRAADQMLRDVLQPDDRFTVVAMGRRLKVLAGMTKTKHRSFESFAELLDDPETWDTYADEREYRQQEVLEQYQADPELGQHLARSYATVEGDKVFQLLDVVRKLLTALEPIRERKMLLYFSAGIPERPGAQYLHLAELDDELIKNTRTTIFEMQRLFQEANSARISMYPVDVTGLDTTFNIHQGAPSINLPGGIPDQLATDYSRKRDGLVSLALNTGGRAILNTNDIGNTLKQVVTASRHYYLLGFTPPSGGDGKYHKIYVRLWDSRWKVDSRTGFVDFNQEQVDERQILGSFMLPEMFSELPLHLEVVPLERRGGKWIAEAQLRVPAAALDRLPQGKGSYGQIELGASLFRGAKLSFHFDRALTLQFPSRFPSAEIVVQQTIEMKPGEYRGIAVARDTISGTVGSMSADFELPPPPKDSVHIGVGRLPGEDVLNAKNERTLAAQREVVWNGEDLATFSTDAVMVFAYLLPGRGIEPPWITHRVLRNGEVVRTSHPSLKPVGRKSRDLASYEEIDASQLGPGRYVLSVTVGRGSADSLAEVEFQVLGAPAQDVMGSLD
jgi:VWFA-related protein